MKRILIVAVAICLVAILSAYRHSPEYKHDLERVKRYAKREVEGNCIYNMCNQTDDYPVDAIRRIIESRPEYRDFFGTVVQPYTAVGMRKRFNGDDDMENMCDTEMHFMLPQRAKDTHDRWQTIVNAGTDYAQVVYFEACATDAHCLAEDEIPNRKTVCSQSKITVKMMAYNSDQTSYEAKPLKITSVVVPSGCSCMHVQR